MTSVLIDSNIIIDVASKDPVWGAWSSAAMDNAVLTGRPVINAVIHAEVAAGYARAEDMDAALSAFNFKWEDISQEAARLAGKAFREYRRRGGVRKSILPDFLIGAHAKTLGLPLLTRDRSRFAGYFPELEIIAPDAGPAPVR